MGPLLDRRRGGAVVSARGSAAARISAARVVDISAAQRWIVILAATPIGTVRPAADVAPAAPVVVTVAAAERIASAAAVRPPGGGGGGGGGRRRRVARVALEVEQLQRQLPGVHNRLLLEQLHAVRRRAVLCEGGLGIGLMGPLLDRRRGGAVVSARGSAAARVSAAHVISGSAAARVSAA